MYIQELRLQNFRKFEDVTLQFHPQFNILIGENASGKTTVCEAIKNVLHMIISQLGGFEHQVDKSLNDVRYSFPKGLSKEHYFPLQLIILITDLLGRNTKCRYALSFTASAKNV
jgi:DNA replication and repair protein RecF